jgi:hypothetical protein
MMLLALLLLLVRTLDCSSGFAGEGVIGFFTSQLAIRAQNRLLKGSPSASGAGSSGRTLCLRRAEVVLLVPEGAETDASHSSLVSCDAAAAELWVHDIVRGKRGDDIAIEVLNEA